MSRSALRSSVVRSRDLPLQLLLVALPGHLDAALGQRALDGADEVGQLGRLEQVVHRAAAQAVHPPASVSPYPVSMITDVSGYRCRKFLQEPTARRAAASSCPLMTSGVSSAAARSRAISALDAQTQFVPLLLEQDGDDVPDGPRRHRRSGSAAEPGRLPTMEDCTKTAGPQDFWDLPREGDWRGVHTRGGLVWAQAGGRAWSDPGRVSAAREAVVAERAQIHGRDVRPG